MSNPNFDDDDDEPLDPAVEKVRDRLRRLIFISAGTLGLGVLALFGAILYKVMEPGSSGSGIQSQNVAASIDVPKSYRIIGMDVDDTSIGVLVDGDDGVSILWFDRVSGVETGKTAIIAR